MMGNYICAGLIVFSIGSFSCHSLTPCAHFDFPTLSDTVVTAAENTTISFPFTIKSDGCTSLGKQTLTLQVTKQSETTEILCQFFHEKGKCRTSHKASSCNCSEKTGLYQFTHTVDRSDNAEWRWSAHDTNVQDATLTFSVLYPARVMDLKIGELDDHLPALVHQGSFVDVVCLWENGNPPVTARLLDRRGVEMEGNIYSSGQINYRFPAVGCQDAGLIRCEAPGASHNKTAMLLVRCPPQFETGVRRQKFDVKSGDDARPTFPVRAHTPKFARCLLRKLHPTTKLEKPKIDPDAESEALKTAADCISLTGTPPDLTLTVRLDNVRKEEEGQWRLELTNDVGTGHVDFDLIVVTDSDSDSVTPQSVLEESNADLSGSNLTVVVVGVNVAVFTTLTIVAVIVICVVRIKRGGATAARQSPFAAEELDSLPPSPPPCGLNLPAFPEYHPIPNVDLRPKSPTTPPYPCPGDQ